MSLIEVPPYNKGQSGIIFTVYNSLVMLKWIQKPNGVIVSNQIFLHTKFQLSIIKFSVSLIRHPSHIKGQRDILTCEDCKGLVFSQYVSTGLSTLFVKVWKKFMFCPLLYGFAFFGYNKGHFFKMAVLWTSKRSFDTVFSQKAR